MTDGDIVRIARKIDALQQQTIMLIWEIIESDHPNASLIEEVLRQNSIPTPAWATHAIHGDLEHPERWETGNYGIRLKRL
jgi:hypothetical protein